METVLNGFLRGTQTAKNQYNLDIRFIANLDRTKPAEINCNYLRQLHSTRGDFPVIAVGLDMKEDGFPASNQKEAFALAKKLGYYITAHAGEEVGPDGIWDLIESCDVDRIDHGVRAVEDEKLMQYLAEHHILLTVCPDSNICLGVYPSWESFPLRQLLDHGVKVSINSDDPPYFQYDLTGNLIKAAETFQLTEKEIATLMTDALQWNFAGKEHLPALE